MDLKNRIIEYLDNKAPKLVLVTREQDGKVNTLDENGRQGKLNTRLIQIVHDPCEPSEFKAAAGHLNERVGEICDELDVDLIWEDVIAGENDGLSTEQLASQYFGQADSAKESAIFRKLLSDGLRFRFKNNLFIARTAEEIEVEQAARAKKQAYDATLREMRKFIRQVHQAGQMLTIPDELEDTVNQLESAFLTGEKNSALELLSALNYDQPVDELAFDVLVKTGRLSPGSDEILKVSGMTRDFPEAVMDQAESVTPFEDDEEREEFSHLLSFSIDDDDTTEVDDAISVEELDDRIRVGIHIADAAYFVEQGDTIDTVASERAATIYMPTGAVLMMPPRISCDLASLTCGELRPTFSMLIDLSTDGEVMDYRICRGKIRVKHRINYEQADAMIAFPGDALGQWLQRLSELCAVNTQKRLDNGATIFSKSEHKVQVTGDTITARAFRTDTPSRNLISELMILCNNLTAEFAEKEGIPLVFRAQVPPDHPASKYQGRVVKDTNPNVFRGLKRGHLTVHPKPHAGLGIDAYTQVSSPLRRFGDLVMQRQLVAYLDGAEEYPYTAAELMEYIGNAEETERSNKVIERRSTRYWELEYIRRQGQQDVTATVMSKITNAYIVAVTPIPVRGKMVAENNHYRFGQKIKVSVDKLIPELSVFKLRYAGPEKQ